MPRVTRRRTIAAPAPTRSGSWSPTPTTCRAGGRGRAGSRTSSSKSGGRRSQWTKVLETARGAGCGPTTAASARPRASATSGSRSSRARRSTATCAARGSRSACAPRRRRHRGRPQLGAGAAGDVAARLADDAARPGRDPRRGARRDRDGRVEPVSARPRRDSKWWGWGDPAIAPELDADGARRPARADRRAGAVAAGAPRLEDVELPQPAAAAGGADRGGRRRARLHRERGPPAPRHRAAATPTWPGCASAASTTRPTRSCCPPTPRRCGACSRPAPREGIAVVPFGGGTSVVGGVEPLRGEPRAADQPRPRRAARGRGRPPLADRPARRRPARPGGRGGAGAAGPHPRPLPAVLRVRDDRRLRRDPLGRPGLERLRALRRAGQLGPPDRPGRRAARRWRRRTRPPGRRCASWSSAPRGCSA